MSDRRAVNIWIAIIALQTVFSFCVDFAISENLHYNNVISLYIQYILYTKHKTYAFTLIYTVINTAATSIKKYFIFNVVRTATQC